MLLRQHPYQRSVDSSLAKPIDYPTFARYDEPNLASGTRYQSWTTFEYDEPGYHGVSIKVHGPAWSENHKTISPLNLVSLNHLQLKRLKRRILYKHNCSLEELRSSAFHRKLRYSTAHAIEARILHGDKVVNALQYKYQTIDEQWHLTKNFVRLIIHVTERACLIRKLEQTDNEAQFGRFVDFAAGIREAIYHIYLSDGPEVRSNDGFHIPLDNEQPPLTRLNRQMRREVLPLHYQDGYFDLVVGSSFGSLFDPLFDGIPRWGKSISNAMLRFNAEHFYNVMSTAG